MKLLMGLDIGTTALKAALFDTKGALLAVTTQEYALLTPQVNYVEEPAEVYWKAFRDGVSALKEKHPLAPTDEIALAISAQGETLFFLDNEGNSLRNAIVWMDNRAMDEAQALKARFGDETCYAVTGSFAKKAFKEAARWGERDRARYFDLVRRCDRETMVQKHYDKGCTLRRNRYMVDRACRLIAVYDGMLGGTMYTLTYAMRRGLTVELLEVEAAG